MSQNFRSAKSTRRKFLGGAAVAMAAPPRNLRRVVGEDSDFFDMHSLHCLGMTFFVIFCELNHPKT